MKKDPCLKRLLYKATTYPIWWLERNRWYPIRNSAPQLLPRLKAASTQDNAPVLAVLCTPDQFGDALWSAWSWYRFLVGCVNVWICCDGEVTRKNKADALKILPKSRVVSLEELWKELDCNIKHLDKIESHPLSRKLKLIIELQTRYTLLYSDCDVIAFNEPVEIKEFMQRNDTCVYMVDTHNVIPVESLAYRALKLNYSYDPLLNSGMFFLPQNILSQAIITELLDGWEPPLQEWTLEQWLLAVTIGRSNSCQLDSEKYVISGARQFWFQDDVDYTKIVCRHFTNPVRHVMYQKGISALLSKLK